MKKIPLAFSGCLLGLAGAGNLLSDTFPVLAHFFSLTGLILWVFFLCHHLIYWSETKIELQEPALLSGMATFPMAGMILSTYLLRLFPTFGGLAQAVWWTAFLLDCGLIFYFTKTHILAKPRANATPSWTVLYVGIAVAALTYPVVGVVELAYLTLGFGFVLTSILYPLIYQGLKTSPLPSHLLGQEGIYCAPFSLLLAALVRVGGASLPVWLLYTMVGVSQAFYFFVLTRLPRMIKEGFQPAFSALTFPTVITATSLKMAQGLLHSSLLRPLVWLETILCLAILVSVLVGFVIYIKGENEHSNRN